MDKIKTRHLAWAALTLALTACTQDELADDNRLPEGEYPVVIRATGLSVEATPQAAPSTQPHPPVPPWTATGRAYRPWHSRWATR